jgi:hypothetical protein
MFQQNLMELANVQDYENLMSGSRVVTCRQTDGDEASLLGAIIEASVASTAKSRNIRGRYRVGDYYNNTI